MPVTNVKTRWTSGNLEFLDKSGNIIATIDGTNRKITFASGAVLDVSAATSTLSVAAGEVGAADLASNLKTGFIPLPLTSFRLIASNDIPNSGAGDGGVISQDTAPKLERVNDATDPQLRIAWAASGVVPVTTQFAYPPDLDDASAVTVNLLAKMAAGGMDTPTITVGYVEGIGDTDAGGATAALSTTLAQLTVAIAAGDVGAYPKAASITLTPGAHANEALELYGAWLTYTRRS